MEMTISTTITIWPTLLFHLTLNRHCNK